MYNYYYDIRRIDNIIVSNKIWQYSLLGVI